MTTTTARVLRTAGATLLLAAPAVAQKDPAVRLDERLRQFTGCWATQVNGMRGPVTCIVGTANPYAVELLTLENDTVVTRVPIDASGLQVERNRDGCRGWERGTWSGDERRLFVQSELTCGSGPLQKSSAIYASTSYTEFSRIEGVKTRGAAGVRVINFRAITPGAGIASAIVDRMPPIGEMRSYAARVEGAAPLSTADVVEAAKAVDPAVVEAWVADRHQGFTLAANDLRALRDAGVTTDVIDMMVAVSHPRVFSLARGGAPGAGLVPEVAQSPRSTANGAPVYFDPTIGDPYLGANPYGYNGSYFGGYGANWAYGRNAYSNLFNPYASCVGALSCGYGYGWAYGGGPYVIVTQPAAPAVPPGRVVNGAGYSQGGSSGGGRTAGPTYDGGGRATTSVGSSGGGGMSTSTGGGGGGSAPAASTGGGEQRTAKPRP